MREHLHTSSIFTPPSLLGDCTPTGTAPPRAPQNYALRLGQCGIAVPDTPLYRIFAVQPQANAGFADSNHPPSLDVHGKTNTCQFEKQDEKRGEEEDALLARLRACAGKAATQPRQLQADIEEAPLIEREEVPQRPRAPTEQLEEVPPRLTAQGSATSSRSRSQNTTPRIAINVLASTSDQDAR